MYIVIEWNGFLPDGYIGPILNRHGDPRFWDSEAKAKRYARENCAFDYKVIELG